MSEYITIDPMNFTCGSGKKIWWKCNKGHEWQASIGFRNQGASCPYCSNKKVCKDNCLSTINPDLAKEWHPTKNGKLTAMDVFCGSSKKVWWRCNKGHEWEALVNNRNKGKGCPYCAGNKVCKDNCLAILNPKLSEEWHPTKNGDLTPNGVVCQSNKKVWWKCNKGHEWKSIIASRNKGKGCPYCTGRIVCKDNCLSTINPELASEWHPTKNGDLTPNDVVSGSGKKVWWKCNKDHEWEATIYHRNRGGGCPICRKESRKKK